MTRDEAIVKLKHLQGEGDTESAHTDADDILCELLCSLGYEDVAKEYGKVGKWYA